MVEPQDPNRLHAMIGKQQEAVLAITELNQDLPQEFQNEARKSLNALQGFRAEINNDLN